MNTHFLGCFDVLKKKWNILLFTLIQSCTSLRIRGQETRLSSRGVPHWEEKKDMNNRAAAATEGLPITIIDLSANFPPESAFSGWNLYHSAHSALQPPPLRCNLFFLKCFNFLICIQSTQPITLSPDTCSNSYSAVSDMVRSECSHCQYGMFGMCVQDVCM